MYPQARVSDHKCTLQDTTDTDEIKIVSIMQIFKILIHLFQVSQRFIFSDLELPLTLHRFAANEDILSSCVTWKKVHFFSLLLAFPFQPIFYPTVRCYQAQPNESPIDSKFPFFLLLQTFSFVQQTGWGLNAKLAAFGTKAMWPLQNDYSSQAKARNQDKYPMSKVSHYHSIMTRKKSYVCWA